MFFGKKKIEVPQEIINFNRFTPNKEKLLCIGAAVTQFAEARRNSQPNYLKLYFPDKYKKKILKYWLPMFNINSVTDVEPVLESWIFDVEDEIPNGVDNKDDVRKEIDKAVKKTQVDGSALIHALETTNDSGAFDLERLGYITRVCFTLDILTEKKAWEYLERLHKVASEQYRSWDEYIVSYSYEDEAMNTRWYKDIIIDYLTIKKDEQNIFDKYPLDWL